MGGLDHYAVGVDPVLNILYFSVMHNLRRLWPYLNNPLGDFSLGLGKLNPEVIRKSYPRQNQAFIMVVERKVRE